MSEEELAITGSSEASSDAEKVIKEYLKDTKGDSPNDTISTDATTNSKGEKIAARQKSKKEIQIEKKFGGMFLDDKRQIAAQRQVGVKMISQIGKKLLAGENIMRISIPIDPDLFEGRPLTKKMTEHFAYTELLQRASAAEGKERMRWVISYALSTLHKMIESQYKPFNSILGETYQSVVYASCGELRDQRVFQDCEIRKAHIEKLDQLALEKKKKKKLSKSSLQPKKNEADIFNTSAQRTPLQQNDNNVTSTNQNDDLQNIDHKNTEHQYEQNNNTDSAEPNISEISLMNFPQNTFRRELFENKEVILNNKKCYCFSEQIQNHPPTTLIHIISEDFDLHSTASVKVHLSGNTMNISRNGLIVVEFPKSEPRIVMWKVPDVHLKGMLVGNRFGYYSNGMRILGIETKSMSLGAIKARTKEEKMKARLNYMGESEVDICDSAESPIHKSVGAAITVSTADNIEEVKSSVKTKNILSNINNIEALSKSVPLVPDQELIFEEQQKKSGDNNIPKSNLYAIDSTTTFTSQTNTANNEELYIGATQKSSSISKDINSNEVVENNKTGELEYERALFWRKVILDKPYSYYYENYENKFKNNSQMNAYYICDISFGKLPNGFMRFFGASAKNKVDSVFGKLEYICDPKLLKERNLTLNDEIAEVNKKVGFDVTSDDFVVLKKRISNIVSSSTIPIYMGKNEVAVDENHEPMIEIPAATTVSEAPSIQLNDTVGMYCSERNLANLLNELQNSQRLIKNQSLCKLIKNSLERMSELSGSWLDGIFFGSSGENPTDDFISGLEQMDTQEEKVSKKDKTAKAAKKMAPLFKRKVSEEEQLLNQVVEREYWNINSVFDDVFLMKEFNGCNKTDYRNRKDIRYFTIYDFKKAQEWKEKLEETQRNDRKLR